MKEMNETFNERYMYIHICYRQTACLLFHKSRCDYSFCVCVQNSAYTSDKQVHAPLHLKQVSFYETFLHVGGGLISHPCPTYNL